MFNASNNIITNHEIACPSNKDIIKFLWTSYFHDSEIEAISFDTDEDSLKIILTSIKDIDDAWDDLKGSRAQRRKYIRDNKENFQYELIFQSCVDYSHQAVEIGCDYLQCYFLNSAKVQRCKQKYNNHYYHLRILTTSGLMDIIFSDFRIKKCSNEAIDYDNLRDFSQDYWMERFQIYASENGYLIEDGSLDHSKLKVDLIQGSDRERCIALYYFTHYTEINIVEEVRQMMNLDREDYELSRNYAVKALGYHGAEEDLLLLAQEYAYLDSKYYEAYQVLTVGLLAKRQVLDAIEMINFLRD